MKILFISESPINNQMSIGNTFLNIFSNMEDVELSSIYTRRGYPDLRYIKNAFQISEIGLIKSILSRKYKGKLIVGNDISDNDDRLKDTKAEAFAKKYSSDFLHIIKNILWKFSPWKKSGIKEYIESVNPDIIFSLFSADTEVNDLILYAKKNSNAKLILYAWDDHYSYYKYSFNVINFIRKFINRRKMRRVFGQTQKMYVISQLQKEDYEKAFNSKLSILMKGAEFKEIPLIRNENKEILQIVYTGNLGCGRWETLAMTAKAVSRINSDGIKLQMKIYSGTPITDKMKKSLSIEGSSFFMGNVPSSEIYGIQEGADILVHVESFSPENKFKVRQSFSTKIVDYLAMAKCILAVGPDDVASIDYLAKNDAALVATAEDEIYKVLNKIIENRSILDEYGKKAWECGKRNHQIEKIQNDLYCDFKEILNESNTD